MCVVDSMSKRRHRAHTGLAIGGLFEARPAGGLLIVPIGCQMPWLVAFRDPYRGRYLPLSFSLANSQLEQNNFRPPDKHSTIKRRSTQRSKSASTHNT
jgi:hypothetical protein